MKALLTILALFISSAIYSQDSVFIDKGRTWLDIKYKKETFSFDSVVVIDRSDSVRVKIKSIKTDGSFTIVKFKTMGRPRIKLETDSCTCKVPYKEKQIIWIKKP